MPRPRKLPAIPAEMFSVLGPVAVMLRDNLLETDDAHGAFGPSQRHVLIDNVEGSTLEHQWQTYWHEATHLALWDAGCHESLNKRQEEMVCNAVATYLTAMMKSGHLKVAWPAKRAAATAVPETTNGLGFP